MIVPVGVVLALSAVLFGIGAFGFLARRNLILMLVSVEIMLNAVILSLAGFSRHLVDPRGQVLALFVIAFIILGYLGTKHVTAARTLVAQICTAIYYAYFLLMPWYTSVEKTKPVPERVPS